MGTKRVHHFNTKGLKNIAVYITGDTHGSLGIGKLYPENSPQLAKLTRKDFVIVLGDFGIPFLLKSPYGNWTALDSSIREKLSALPYTLLFLDGNHDNHTFWASLPTEPLACGRVHRMPQTKNVYHLCRGEIYELNNKAFWVFGGATSIDRHTRIEGISWWKGETSSFKEELHGIDNLISHDSTVDYILTHTTPEFIKPTLGLSGEPCPVSQYLNNIYQTTIFKHWYCGHMHEDKDLDFYKLCLVFNDIIKLP